MLLSLKVEILPTTKAQCEMYMARASVLLLENPMDGGGTPDGVAGSQKRLIPFHFSVFCIGEGNGNPLQCSCLENPRDGGA